MKHLYKLKSFSFHVKKIIYPVLIALIVSAGCSSKTNPELRGSFNFFYKSNSNPDLLNPQTGVYNPSQVKVVEVVETAGVAKQIPAPSESGSYVYSNDVHPGIYFINYQCSIYANKANLKMALIRLSGVTDTLTFKYSTKDVLYPDTVFYNKKPVWQLGDGNEITITK